MSDSCQLDQLTLRRLDSSLAATRRLSPCTPSVHRGVCGGAGGAPLPAPITVSATGGSRFVQNFLRININHCQVVFNAGGQAPASPRWVTFQLSNAHKLFHWAKFPPGWTGSMYCTHPNAVTSKYDQCQQ